MQKQHYFKLAIILLEITIAILVLETASRIYLEPQLLKFGSRDWRDTDTELRNSFHYSEKLGFEPNLDQCCLFPELALENNKTKVLGKKTDKPLLILILGDSITHRARYPKLLETKLNSLNKRESYQVISVGVESYNTAQEVEFLKSRILPKITPDLILIQFTLNDFDYSPIVVQVGNEIAYIKSPREKFVEQNSFLFKLSSLYRYIKLKNFISTFVDAYAEDWDSKINTMDSTLEDLNLTLSQKQIPYLFLIYPYFTSLQPESEHEIITTLLKSKGIDYIDLLPVFQTYGSLDQWTTIERGQVDKVHPNRKSDSIVADSITKYFELKTNEGKISGIDFNL